MTTLPADSPPPTKSMPSRVHYTLDFASPRLATRPYLPRVFDSIGVIYFLTCALFRSGYTFGVLIDFTLSKNFRPGTFFALFIYDFSTLLISKTLLLQLLSKIWEFKIYDFLVRNFVIKWSNIEVFSKSMTLLPYKLPQIKSHILRCDCRMFEQMLELGSSD